MKVGSGRMSIVGAKKKMWAEVWAQQKTHKKRRPQKKKMTMRQKIKKIFSKNAHSRNVGACEKKKIVGTAHTFFIKFLGAHNTHTPRRDGT